jgi:hypothetical protein
MSKLFLKKIIAILTIVTIVFLSIGILKYFHVYEGLDTNTDDNEIRAVSHLQKEKTPNAVTDMLVSTLQLYDPKLVADRINSTADQLNAIAKNVDSSKFAALYGTFLEKLNPPYETSAKSGIVSNATIANSYLNTQDSPAMNTSSNVVASGPSTTINASSVNNTNSSTKLM